MRRGPRSPSVTSWYDTQAPGLVSTDRHATYALVRLHATDEDAKTDAFEATAAGADRRRAGHHDAVRRQRAVPRTTPTSRPRADLARAETLSLPVLLILLILIFGGLVAAATPLLIGGLAILGAFVAIRLLDLRRPTSRSSRSTSSR